MDDLHRQALAAHRQGDAARARALCEEMLRRSPAHPGAMFLLGAIATQDRRLPDAVRFLAEACRLAPQEPTYHHARGEALRLSGQHEHAVLSYRAALEARPALHQALNGLGLSLLELGRAEEAIDAFRQGVALAPGNERLRVNLSQALMMRGDDAEAEEHCRAALRLRPGYPVALGNLGMLLHKRGELREALPLLAQAAALQPANPEAHLGLANTLLAIGETRPAIASFRETLRLRPGDARALNNLGAALALAGEHGPALEAVEEALRLDPRLAEAHLNLGNLSAHAERHDLALAAYEEAQRLAPRPETKALLLRAREMLCDWRTRGDDERRLAALRERTPIDPFHALSQPWTPGELLANARAAASRLLDATAEARRGLGFAHPRRRTGRLRVGYLSGSFRHHATMHLMRGVFALHDRTRFEVFAYSHGPDDGSFWRAAAERDCDLFRDLRGASLADAARAIHADGVHVLVDLDGFTSGARLDIVAVRPAPVVAHAVGFAGTLGGVADYWLGDPVVSPPESWDTFAEAVAMLPGCYLPADRGPPLDPAPQTRAAHGLPEEGFVFVCFNQPYKIVPPVFDLWMRLLRAVPGSVLWLLAQAAASRDNLRREAAARGIGPERLVFAPTVPKARHLTRLGLADLFLDTLPYNAHTTAADALWAGVPVLTRLGENVAGRVAASMLAAAGLPETVTHSIEEYETAALRLATRPEELATLKARLLGIRALFDTGRWVRGAEQACLEMWRRWEQGLPPASFEASGGA